MTVLVTSDVVINLPTFDEDSDASTHGRSRILVAADGQRLQ